jgi:hypothetical protein
MTGEQFGLMTDNGLKGFPSALMLGKNCEIVGKLLGYNEIVETLDRRCASDHMGSEKKL